MHRTFLSIITPYNGSKTFILFLQSLLFQTLDTNLFEIIIVQEDNCNADLLLMDYKPNFKFKVVTHYKSNIVVKHSAGVLRNYGATKASGKVLVFIDSDCILDKNCLFMHYNFHTKHSESVLCGETSELPFYRQNDINTQKLLESVVGNNDLLIPDYRKRNKIIIDSAVWQELYSSNASIPAASFNKISGFDEKGYRCHDMDLSYRLFQLNLKYYYDPQCRTVHFEHERSIKYREEQINGWKWIGTKHPELKDLCENKITLFKKVYARVSINCRTQFLEIARLLNHGLVVDNNIIIETLFHNGKLESVLCTVPHIVHEENTYSRYQLRLNRDCWDFNILVLKSLELTSPKFTVLIPFRNNINLTIRSIKSILKQTFTSFEIILINDHSTSRNFPLLYPYLKSKRIKLINNSQNFGQSKSLNIGLSKARGIFIVQLDSDDWMVNTGLETISDFLIKSSAEALYGNPFLVRYDNVIREKGQQINNPNECFTYEGVQAPRVYKTSLLKKIGGWDISDSYLGHYYEDRVLLHKIAIKTKLWFLDKSIYYASVRNDSLSRRKPLTVASAKLSILINQANKDNKILNYCYKNYFLKGNFTDRTNKNLIKTWSVIITFKRNISHLKIVLESWLEALESVHGSSNVDIIIVNDSELTLSKHMFNPLLPLMVYNTGGNKGPAFTRNMGVTISNSEFLFFCDEDHVVCKDVLSQHEQSHQENSTAIVVGGAFGRRVLININDGFKENIKRTILDNYWFEKDFELIASTFALGSDLQVIQSKEDIYHACFKNSFSEHWQREWGEIYLSHTFNLEEFPHAWLKCATANLSMSREQFYHVGKFNEELRSMEDWEFGLRALEKKLKIIVCPFAEPFHIIHAIEESRAQYDNESLEILLQKYDKQIQQFLESDTLTSLHKIFRKKNVLEITEKKNFNNKNTICLTFDDGPHGYNTEILLNWLDENNITATFFVLGSKALLNKEMVKQIAASGHEIGIHGWNHTEFIGKSVEKLISDLNKTKELLEQIINKPIRLVRPPYGVIDENLALALHNNGYCLFGWNVSSKDWTIGITKEEIITNIAVGGIRNKVLLFHDGVGESLVLIQVLNWLNSLFVQDGITSITASQYLEFNNFKDFSSGLRSQPNRYTDL